MTRLTTGCLSDFQTKAPCTSSEPDKVKISRGWEKYRVWGETCSKTELSRIFHLPAPGPTLISVLWTADVPRYHDARIL
jgi:hypothetical protein